MGERPRYPENADQAIRKILGKPEPEKRSTIGDMEIKDTADEQLKALQEAAPAEASMSSHEMDMAERESVKIAKAKLRQAERAAEGELHRAEEGEEEDPEWKKVMDAARDKIKEIKEEDSDK